MFNCSPKRDWVASDDLIAYQDKRLSQIVDSCSHPDTGRESRIVRKSQFLSTSAEAAVHFHNALRPLHGLKCEFILDDPAWLELPGLVNAWTGRPCWHTVEIIERIIADLNDARATISNPLDGVKEKDGFSGAIHALTQLRNAALPRRRNSNH